MTENIKKLLELVSNNEELKNKLNNAPREEFIAIAKEQGITLTEADFEAGNGELSEDELDTVTGGVGLSYFIDHGGMPVEVVIGDPDRKPKPIKCHFRGIGKR